jgi:hypothetical protein
MHLSLNREAHMQITEQKIVDLYSWLLHNKDFLKIEMKRIDKEFGHFRNYIYDVVMLKEFDDRFFKFKTTELRHIIFQHNSEFSMQELRYMIYESSVQAMVREILLY